MHSILNHIAYVNRAALPNQPDVATSEPTNRKSQVQKVLNATYITALLGLVLCVADVGRLCGPYGLMAPITNSTDLAPVSTPKNHSLFLALQVGLNLGLLNTTEALCFWFPNACLPF